VVSTKREREPLSIVPASVYLVGGFSTGKFYAVGLVAGQVGQISNVEGLAAGLLACILTFMAGVARRYQPSAIPYCCLSRIICANLRFIIGAAL